MAQTHPDRLASVATLFGMEPAPVTACRVLEIGCGSGGNLIPMAYYLPGSRFTGIDLAEEPVAEARRAARKLLLTNLTFIAMDLRDIGPAMGEFDYIVAHGLYSWIPAEVRDRLLAVCRERLAPHGVACVSYNCLPGRHVRMMLREMMLHHIRDCTTDQQRIEQARALLRMIGSTEMFSPAWQPAMAEEIAQMLEIKDGWFFHDDLAALNECFYFRDFAAHAARHSLQYLGDAEAHLMFDVKKTLDWLGDNLIEREQYLDFLRLRRFRHTLLCRREVALERPAGPAQMDRFLFSSPGRATDGQIEGFHSVRVPAAQSPVVRVAAAMRETYPLPVAFEDFLNCAVDRETLRDILFESICSGFAELHIYHFASGVSVSARPRASRLARWESARSGVVTYSNHTSLKLDTVVHELIELLDGKRKFEEIVAALARTRGAPPREQIRATLPHILDHMANTGLLEG